MGVMDGKQGVIVGIANELSIAWAIAQQLHSAGASIGYTHLPDKDLDRPKNRNKVARLVETLDENYGYHLYRAVSRPKEALSAGTRAEFRFKAGSIRIVREVARAEFEAWIAPELAQIEGAVDAALADAGLAPGQIDRVFLTGGSSLVPAVREVFHRRFAADR